MLREKSKDYIHDFPKKCNKCSSDNLEVVNVYTLHVVEEQTIRCQNCNHEMVYIEY